MSDTVTQLLALAGVIGSAGLAVVGVIYTSRKSSQAQKATSEIEQQKVDAAALDRAKSIWGDLIDDLERRVGDQQQRIEALEKDRAADRRVLRAWIEHGRKLGQMLRELGAEPPPEPAESADYSAA